MLETLKEAVERAQALPAYATYKDKLTYTFGLVVESDQPRRSRGTGVFSGSGTRNATLRA